METHPGCTEWLRGCLGSTNARFASFSTMTWDKVVMWSMSSMKVRMWKFCRKWRQIQEKVRNPDHLWLRIILGQNLTTKQNFCKCMEGGLNYLNLNHLPYNRRKHPQKAIEITHTKSLWLRCRWLQTRTPRRSAWPPEAPGLNEYVKSRMGLDFFVDIN